MPLYTESTFSPYMKEVGLVLLVLLVSWVPVIIVEIGGKVLATRRGCFGTL